MRGAGHRRRARASGRAGRWILAACSSSVVLLAACGVEPAKDGDARLVDLREDITTSTARPVASTSTTVQSAGPMPSYVPPPGLTGQPGVSAVSPVGPPSATSPGTGSLAPAEVDPATPSTTVAPGSTSSSITPTTTGSRPQQLTIGGLSPSVRLDQSPVAISVAGLGGPVTASVTASGDCAVEGDAITLLGAGTCTVRADAPAQGGYAAASASVSFVVAKGRPVITTAVPDGSRQPYSPNGIAIDAGATGGRPVDVTVVGGADGCTVAGGRVLPGAASSPSCVVNLVAPGDDDWEPATATVRFDFARVAISWLVEWSDTDPLGEGGVFPVLVRLTHPDVSLDADVLGRFSVTGVVDQCSDGVLTPAVDRAAAFAVTASPSADWCDLTIGFTPFEWYVPGGPIVVRVPVTHAATGLPPSPG